MRQELKMGRGRDQFEQFNQGIGYHVYGLPLSKVQMRVDIFFEDEVMPDFGETVMRQLAVRTCSLCFVGYIRVPLIKQEKWVNQGIDLFFEDHPVMAAHRCVSNAHPKGIWVARKAWISESNYADLVAIEGITPGAPVTDRGFKQ